MSNSFGFKTQFFSAFSTFSSSDRQLYQTKIILMFDIPLISSSEVFSKSVIVIKNLWQDFVIEPNFGLSNRVRKLRQKISLPSLLT